MPLVGQFGGIGAAGFFVPGGAFESIATVTVGSGGAADVEFTSIPSTYQHLQIRVIMKSSTSGNPNLVSQLNGSAAGYASHWIRGTGSSVIASASTSLAYLALNAVSASTNTNVFGAAVIDILDYASTIKNTTFRVAMGYDQNGSGEAGINSGLWNNTAAVTSVKLYPDSGNFAQHSTFALYGIKAP